MYCVFCLNQIIPELTTMTLQKLNLLEFNSIYQYACNVLYTINA